MPRPYHNFRPSWYSERVSKEVGRSAGVTTRAAFTDDLMDILWKNRRALENHPRAKTRLVQVRNPSSPMSRQIALDSKSLRRAEMFVDQSVETARRGRGYEKEGVGRTSAMNRGLTRQWHDANTARQMHEFNSPERVFRSAYHSVKPNPSLPYKPATPSSGRIPKPQRPSSGAAPRIAGAGAAAILKGTGALGALPAIIHLARGGSLGSLAGRSPLSDNDPVITYLDKRTGKTFKMGGGWS